MIEQADPVPDPPGSGPVAGTGGLEVSGNPTPAASVSPSGPVRESAWSEWAIWSTQAEERDDPGPEVPARGPFEVRGGTGVARPSESPAPVLPAWRPPDDPAWDPLKDPLTGPVGRSAGARPFALAAAFGHAATPPADPHADDSQPIDVPPAVTEAHGPQSAASQPSGPQPADTPEGFQPVEQGTAGSQPDGIVEINPAGVAAPRDASGEVEPQAVAAENPVDPGTVRFSFAELAAVTELAGARTAGAGAVSVRAGEHAQEETEAAVPTLAPLLLHSLADLREIWVPLIEASGARSIAEIGSESGVTTSLLVDLLRRGGGGRLVVVDPDPGVEPASGGGLDVHVIRGYSPQALDDHAPTDAYLLDGDHNYATVRGELAAIAAAVVQFGRSYFPLVILHDVGWPAGRRDQYYAPDRIAQDYRQPHSWDVGVEIDNPGVVRGGFRGMGAFAWALTEGGARNGVRTAIEDFVAEHPDLRFFTVAPIFGLGVVVDRRAPWARRVADLLTPWVSNPLLSRLERNRIDLYLQVLRLQDTAATVARARQREWSRLDEERSRLAAAELDHLARIAELEHELAESRRQATAPGAEGGPGPSGAGPLADGSRLAQVARIAGTALRSRLSPAGQDRLDRVQARVADVTVPARTNLPVLRGRPGSPSR
ncbi:O-methyltransferase [Frankia sp. AiPs1]|uniref:class I SAM-dependent methyltransferase n=1 Tax=Frankia sp. AiPa1 TaxID=573492 RepID=UPI00202AF97E|nr:class I SAM-dependent methyltransferase [Frankia sp. AiPa1]MCL9757686.1 class I SAM-dependent methyltransferase [Frankia sp. AiPa1]